MEGTDDTQDRSPAHRPAARATDSALGSAVRTVSGLTLVSRLTGLARDLVLARVVGDSALGSAFMAAWVLPNTFRRLFGEGALSAAFLPEYARAETVDQEHADALATLVVRGLVLVTGVVLLLGEAVLLALLLAAGGEESRDLSFLLMMVLLPFMPMVCVAAILGAMLQTHGRFAVPAAAPVVLNVLVIAAASIHFVPSGPDARTTTFIVGGSALVAGVAQVAWSWLALRGRFRWRGVGRDAHEAGRRVLRRFGPVVVGMGALQINSLLDTLIAMWPIWIGATIFGVAYPLDEASNAVLGFTQRLYQFPLGVFGIAVATAVFPALARHADDPTRFGETLTRGLRLSLFIGAPASVGLVLVRQDLVAVMYGGPGSAFSADGVARSAAVLLGYAPAVWAYSLNHVFTRAHYAMGDTRTPMRISLACIGVNLVLNITLIWWLREAGMAWATALAACVQLVLLAITLPASIRGSVAGAGGSALRTLALTLAMCGGVWLAGRLAPESDQWRSHAVRLGATVLGGMVAYGAGALVLRAPELRWLTARGR